MVEYSASARDDKLGAIGDQLNEIKGVMAKNIGSDSRPLAQPPKTASALVSHSVGGSVAVCVL